MKFHKKYRSRWSRSNWACKFKKETKQLTYTIGELIARRKLPNHWLDDFLNGVQNAIYMPLDFIHSIHIYLHNRFKTKTHVLVSNLEKGVWHDYSERIVTVISDSFIDWMETEYCGCDKFDADKLIKKHLWEVNLKYDESMCVEVDDPLFGTPTRQATKAKTLFEIYQYWKYQRPTLDVDEYGYVKSDTEYLNMIIENRNSMWT
jgi:hypothetical protein